MTYRVKSIGAVVCLHAALWVQVFVDTGSGRP